jgi:hypothetical protein
VRHADLGEHNLAQKRVFNVFVFNNHVVIVLVCGTFLQKIRE